MDKEFILYCQLNNIENIEKLATETFNRGFALLKYGETPTAPKPKQPEVKKEIIIQDTVELPTNHRTTTEQVNPIPEVKIIKKDNTSNLYDE